MRVELKKLLEKLGVDHPLEPYETHPWLHYDEGRGLTCSAEVRMGPVGDDLEAEIQFMYDEGREPPPPPPPVLSPEDKKKLAESGGKTEETGSGGSTGDGGPIQIMRMRAKPADGVWTPKELVVKGKDLTTKVHDWEEKSCTFFRACIEALQMSEIPNIDELIEKELDDGDSAGGKRGRIGRKAPKIKPAQLLGIKKGM